MNKKILKLVILLWSPILLCAQQSEMTLHLGYDSSFFDTVKKNDALSALKVWVKTFVDQSEKKYNAKANVDLGFSDDVETLIKHGAASKFDLINILALDYIKFRSNDYWVPIAISARDGHFPEEYVLLAHRDSQLKNLEDLRLKSIALTAGIDRRFSQLWMDNLLQKKFKISSRDYFSNIKEQPKQSSAVLAVFFKRLDACVVGYNTFKTMKELNPQIGKELITIATSPPIVKGLLCLRKNYDSRFKPLILENILHFDKTTSGTHVLTLFGESRLLKFENQYLLPLANMVHEQNSSLQSTK